MRNELFAEKMKARLKDFALRIMVLSDAMPNTVSAWAIKKQIVRSGTSPFANYRAACRGKSDKDFLNKLKIVVEELDETGAWLELIEAHGFFPKSKIERLQVECEELTKIIQTSINSMAIKMTNGMMK